MNRNLSEVKSITRQPILLMGNFATNGTGAPASAKGGGVTVTRTGVGAYKLTLQDAVVDILYAKVELGLGTPAALVAQLGTIAKNASNRFEIPFTILSGTTPTEVAAAAGNVVQWIVCCQQSTTRP